MRHPQPKKFCENIKNVGKVKSITHLDILNYDGSDNWIKDGDKDRVICDCGERQVVMVFEVIMVAALSVFFICITASILSHCRKVVLKCRENM